MTSVFVLAAGNERGGAASHLATYAEALQRDTSADAKEVTFLVAGEGYLLHRLQSVGAKLQTVPAEPRQAISAITQVVRATERSALHAHGPRWNLVASRVARQTGCRFVSTIHSNPQQDFLGSRWKTVLYPRLNARALRGATGLFVVNPGFSDMFPGKPSKFVPNAVAPIRLPEPPEAYRQQLRDRLGVPQDTFIAGTAARLDKVKDLQTLVRAAVRLPHNQHVAIAGDGPERDRLEQLCNTLQVSDRVHFLGFIDDVHAFCAGLDAHVLTSRSEGTPSSVLEAGWLMIPNVGTAIPGLTHLVVDGQTGCTVPVGDFAALAAALTHVFDHPEVGRNYAACFADTILPQYLPERMVAAYLEGYDAWFGGELWA